MNYSNYIEVVPGKRGGQPCVRGTRITVSDVLGWIDNDIAVIEIIHDFPELSAEQIQACVLYSRQQNQN